MKKSLFLAFVAFALWSCGDSSNDLDATDDTRHDEEYLETGAILSDYFITNYLVASKVEVKEKGGEFYLEVSGDRYYTYKDHPTYEKAKKFAELYGDTSFKGYIIPGSCHPLAYPIDKMTISCGNDYDAEHPAGEPLDDIVKLEFETFYEYVKNGYELPSDIPREITKNGDTVMHLMNFEDINADVATLVNLKPFKAQMINVTPLLHFASEPETPGEYTFTLEMTTNGETFTTEFTHTFE